MKLTTIDDLAMPHAHRSPLVERAMCLGKWYGDFKASDNDAHAYDVSIHGHKARAAGLHASEISKCKRLLTYSVMGAERRSAEADKADVNMRMRFDLGHAVHAMLQNDFHRMCQKFNGALTFEDEVHISPRLGGVAKQWNMNSSCDGVFTFHHEGAPYLRVGVEIKTASANEYDKLTRPYDEHMEQTCFYQRALDLPLMWIVYYNKSNSNWTTSEAPWLFQFDQHMWSTKLEPRFGEVVERAARNDLPNREEGRGCSWCPFAWTCSPTTLKSTSATRGPSAVLRNPGALRVHPPKTV